MNDQSNPSEFIDLKIGILGGGQLGKMLSVAAAQWSLDLEIMDFESQLLKKGNASHFVFGDATDYDQVMEFGKDKDIITIEKENVNVQALFKLQENGVKVCPDPKSLSIIQDKYEQKKFYHDNGFKTTYFYELEKSKLIENIQQGTQPLPFVLKHKTSGYDGKGVSVIRNIEELNDLEEKSYLIEEYIDIKKELSVIAARNHGGQVELYDIVEPAIVDNNFLMKQLISPADISKDLKENIRQVARNLITEFNIEGLLAIEFFIDKDDQFYINEVSPRPHNTGHHTIELNSVSQFEQHWRGVLNLPLGDTTTNRHAMCINVLGAQGPSGAPKYHGIRKLYSTPDIYIHLYGKKESKPNRKLGHITIISDNADSLKEKADFVQQNFKVST